MHESESAERSETDEVNYRPHTGQRAAGFLTEVLPVLQLTNSLTH